MDGHLLDICIIDDDPAQRALLTRSLAEIGLSTCEAASGAEGLQLIYRQRPRLVICDVHLPDMGGIDVCRRVRADPTLDGTYLVLLTADGSPALKARALAAGGDDYLTKPVSPVELHARIRTGMRFHRLQERLHQAARTDGLTDLWNYSEFCRLLEREFSRTQRYGGVVSLLMIDLDHFKAINDTFGHEVGNEVLRRVAQHLQRTVRNTDIVARYGGEEFCVICPETTLDEASRLADRLRRSLIRCVRLSQHPRLQVRASIGVGSTSDPRVGSVVDLINLADQALYCSKQSGRNRVTRCDVVVSSPHAPAQQPGEVDRLRKELYSMGMRWKELCLQSVWTLIQALDARDRYSAWHSRNVMRYVQWLAAAAGWPRSLRMATANAAALHDMGKIGIPDSLLLKPQPLTQEEWTIMRQVPLITCKILEPLKLFETEVCIIRHLRERYDGSGYPDGLVGAEIPIGSRLLAVAEAFDSLTCNRAYRAGRSMDDAVAVIAAEAGKQFDPAFVDLLQRTVRTQRRRWQMQIDRARVELPEVTSPCAPPGRASPAAEPLAG